MQRNNDGPDWGGPFRESRQHLQVAIAVAQIVSLPLATWTRRPGTWGERFANHQLALGVLAIPLFTLAFPEADPRPVGLAFWLTLGMLLVHRVRGVRLRRRGYRTHSQYSGQSWVPGDEWKAKGTWEPLLALVAGGALCLYSPPVGVWLVAASFCQGLVVGLAQDEEKAVLRAARDARIRAQYEMELLRKEVEEN